MGEFSIIQNNILGALALHSFIKEYYGEKNENSGVEIALIMPVLPLVFNSRSCKCLADVRRITQTRFLSTLSDFRDIPAGLQQRMIDMSDQTLESLNMALSLNLISLNSENGQFFPVKYLRKLPKMEYGINQEVLHASKVLGSWFAGFSIEEICLSLNITF
jgi:hypothetical protein